MADDVEPGVRKGQRLSFQVEERNTTGEPAVAVAATVEVGAARDCFAEPVSPSLPSEFLELFHDPERAEGEVRGALRAWKALGVLGLGQRALARPCIRSHPHSCSQWNYYWHCCSMGRRDVAVEVKDRVIVPVAVLVVARKPAKLENQELHGYVSEPVLAADAGYDGFEPEAEAEGAT